VSWTWWDGGIDTVLAVYTGNALGNLVPVASNDNFDGFHTLGSAVSFRAIQGRTYSIAVATGLEDYEPFVLHWYPGVIIYGTAAAEFFRGTPGRDYIASGGGNDIVKGLAGADVISGGDGADILRGGRGNDVLGSRIFGQEDGPDVMIGGPGSDLIRGRRGNDRLISRDGVRGNDVVRGGAGIDRVWADPGDRVHGVP
jgi:Ca2+-binding RTX toxin-like protein